MCWKKQGHTRVGFGLRLGYQFLPISDEYWLFCGNFNLGARVVGGGGWSWWVGKSYYNATTSAQPTGPSVATMISLCF